MTKLATVFCCTSYALVVGFFWCVVIGWRIVILRAILQVVLCIAIFIVIGLIVSAYNGNILCDGLGGLWCGLLCCFGLIQHNHHYQYAHNNQHANHNR